MVSDYLFLIPTLVLPTMFFSFPTVVSPWQLLFQIQFSPPLDDGFSLACFSPTHLV